MFLFIVLPISLGYLFQAIEKNTWGDYQYKVTVDSEWYATNDYHIDEDNCIHFIDNYDQKWMWCEKWSVGEYYFNKNKPTLKTIWFGI